MFMEKAVQIKVTMKSDMKAMSDNFGNFHSNIAKTLPKNSLIPPKYVLKYCFVPIVQQLKHKTKL